MTLAERRAVEAAVFKLRSMRESLLPSVNDWIVGELRSLDEHLCELLGKERFGRSTPRRRRIR